MSEYTFHLPFPPSVNTYYSVVRGRKVLSKRGRLYKLESMEAMIEQGLDSKGIDFGVSVVVILNPPCKRKRDLDNYLKAILDAITYSEFWVDDSQVHDLRIIRGVKSKVANIEVTVKKL